ncbi:MAG: alpha/beta fold hydrolase [Anaerolineaceae bacterium]|nr:alpha/beta fold hydrolase [Anaerolineaceae bacterium]
MEIPAPLTGITERMVQTHRLTQHVYFSGPENGIPVIFLHGNFAAALYWEETLQALPPGYRGIAPDLRGYGWSEEREIDSTLGMRVWSEDLLALMQALGIARVHLVGWSMGGGIAYRMITDHAAKLLSVTLVSPVSPYGFGGTKGVDGAPCWADFAGSGGGVVNPVFIQRIQMNDRGTDDPNSPRTVINSFYYKPPYRAAREEDFLTAALRQKTGPEAYPGDFVPSPNWPNVGPGVKGVVNAWSPKYLRRDAGELVAASSKPPILWMHGDSDMIVSDNSMFDLGYLGKLGYVPGWPGEAFYPPQPMIAQTRAVFEQYAQHGGAFTEAVIANAAHAAHIEKPEEFNRLFHPFLEQAKPG